MTESSRSASGSVTWQSYPRPDVSSSVRVRSPRQRTSNTSSTRHSASRISAAGDLSAGVAQSEGDDDDVVERADRGPELGVRSIGERTQGGCDRVGGLGPARYSGVSAECAQHRGAAGEEGGEVLRDAVCEPPVLGTGNVESTRTRWIAALHEAGRSVAAALGRSDDASAPESKARFRSLSAHAVVSFGRPGAGRLAGW